MEHLWLPNLGTCSIQVVVHVVRIISELLYIFHFSYQNWAFDHFMLKSALEINKLLSLLLLLLLLLLSVVVFCFSQLL